MARPTLTQEQVRTRRDEILDVAEDLFENQGLEAVSFRRIAARHGCSPAATYRYFPNKEHVLLGLRIRAANALRDSLSEAAAAESEPRPRLRAIAEAYLRFALERPSKYALLFEMDRGAQDDPDFARAKNDALGVCRDALGDAQSRGDLSLQTDPLTAAHLFWAAVHGAVSLHQGGQLVVGRSLDDIMPTLVNTLMSGLTRPGASQ